MGSANPTTLPLLNEIVGLSPAAAPEELGEASEQRFKDLFEMASRGDVQAQAELLRLRLAYLNWAYAGRCFRSSAMQAA
jgi:hypothetical protein